MKIKQHLAKEVSIDGSGGVYIVNHREKRRYYGLLTQARQPKIPQK